LFEVKFELLENEILGDAALVGQPTIYRDAPVRVKMRWQAVREGWYRLPRNNAEDKIWF
jgi:hypothetical protein